MTIVSHEHYICVYRRKRKPLKPGWKSLVFLSLEERYRSTTIGCKKNTVNIYLSVLSVTLRLKQKIMYHSCYKLKNVFDFDKIEMATLVHGYFSAWCSKRTQYTVHTCKVLVKMLYSQDLHGTLKPHNNYIYMYSSTKHVI